MDLQPLELTYYIILTCQTLVIRTLKLGTLTLNIVLTVLLTYCMIGCFPDSYLNKKLFHQGYTIHLFVRQCLSNKFPFIKESKLNLISIHGPHEINVGILRLQIPESKFGIHGGNTKPCHCLCLVFLQKRQSSGLCKAKRSFLDGIQKAPKKSPILEDYSAMAFISGRPQLSLTSRSISGNLSFLVKPAAFFLLTALVLGYYNFCIQIRKTQTYHLEYSVTFMQYFTII